MKIIKTVNWTAKNGKQIEVGISVEKGVIDNIINLDGDRVNIGKKTNESISIEVKADGKFITRSYNKPEPLNRKFYNNYDELVSKGAYARLGDAFINENQYNIIVDAINEAYTEIGNSSEFDKVKAEEDAKKAVEELAEKRNAEQYKKMVNNGLCPKCGTYCYGDCEAN